MNNCLLIKNKGGIFVFKFMEIYADDLNLILCMIAQAIVVSWVWGKAH